MARIVVVDDSPLIRTILSTALCREGHDLREIDPISVFEVLDVLRAAPPDLVLLDVLMPGCPGHGVLKAIRSDLELKGLAVAVVTASRDAGALESLRRLGISGCLFKPVDPVQLVIQVRQILEEASHA